MHMYIELWIIEIDIYNSIYKYLSEQRTEHYIHTYIKYQFIQYAHVCVCVILVYTYFYHLWGLTLGFQICS